MAPTPKGNPTLKERSDAKKAGKADPAKQAEAPAVPFKPKSKVAGPEPKKVGEPMAVFHVARMEMTTAPLDKLHNFQAGEFKELTTENELKLRREILELGFIEPLTVCHRHQEGKGFWILNGCQRADTMRRLVKEGAIEPSDLPLVVLPDILTEQDMARACLALTSQFGQLTKKGMKRMLRRAKLDADEAQERFNFPELNLAKLDEEPKEKKAKEEGEDEPEEGKGKRHKEVNCPKCGHKFKVRA